MFIFLFKMAARICKNLIRALLREKMKELKVPGSEPYRQLVLALFNIFSGNSKELSHEFWTSTQPPPLDDDDDHGEGQGSSGNNSSSSSSTKTRELKGGLEYYIEKVNHQYYFF